MKTRWENWLHRNLLKAVKRWWAWRGDAAGQWITGDPNGDDLYLLRTYILPRSFKKLPVSVFLHYFARGDKDRELHNHPWNVSFGIILAGGYREHRLHEAGQRIVTREFRPGSVNVLRANDFHRVELLYPEGCWTLFVRFKRMQEWGFLDMTPGAGMPFTPWKEHLFQQGFEKVHDDV